MYNLFQGGNIFTVYALVLKCYVTKSLKMGYFGDFERIFHSFPQKITQVCYILSEAELYEDYEDTSLETRKSTAKL